MYIYRCTRDEHVTYVVASHIELSRIFCRYCAFSNVIKKFNSLFSRITVANFCNFGKNNNGISYKSLLRKYKNIRSIFFFRTTTKFSRVVCRGRARKSSRRSRCADALRNTIDVDALPCNVYT